MPCSLFFYVANVSFNAICENKILEKISEFTVIHLLLVTILEPVHIAIVLFSLFTTRGRVAQSVTCLTADACLTADPFDYWVNSMHFQ